MDIARTLDDVQVVVEQLLELNKSVGGCNPQVHSAALAAMDTAGTLEGEQVIEQLLEVNPNTTTTPIQPPTTTRPSHRPTHRG